MGLGEEGTPLRGGLGVTGFDCGKTVEVELAAVRGDGVAVASLRGRGGVVVV